MGETKPLRGGIHVLLRLDPVYSVVVLQLRFLTTVTDRRLTGGKQMSQILHAPSRHTNQFPRPYLYRSRIWIAGDYMQWNDFSDPV